jgi:hypothetical protein
MFREERRGDAGQHQTRKDGDGHNVLPDLLPPLRLRRAKDDALHLVVYPSTCLERARAGVAGQVVQVRLEEPKGLADMLAAGHQMTACTAHQQRPIDRLLAQIYNELLQGHRLVIDADEEVA